VQVKSSAVTKWEDRGGAIDKGELIMVIVGPYPPVEIPDTPLTDYVLEHATEFGDKPALIDGPTGRTISYTNLIGRVRVSPHKRVRYVEVVEAIPKSASGKILRRMLKDEEVPAR
jgi:acyl-CoA synthetase (AMP-forming)/AMP-acid ligase II